MLERFDSPFPDGKDPQGRQDRVEYYLGQLQYADVAVKVGDGTKTSEHLFKNGEHAEVLAYLWSRNPTAADELNDLGCAHAWAWSWEEANARLKASKEAGNATDDQKKRADHNVGLVASAKKAATS